MEIAILFALICLNGVFAMSEIALVTARKARLQKLIDEGDNGAAAAVKLGEDPTRFLSTIQIGITSIGVLNGIVGEAALAAPLAQWLTVVGVPSPYAGYASTGLVVVLITYFSIVVGELVPKRIGQSQPETFARLVARPINLLAVATKPFVLLLSGSTRTLLRLLGVKETSGSPVTEEEIHAMLVEGTTAGVIESHEHTMVRNVFRLDDRQIGSLMVPRGDVVCLDLDAPFEENLRRIEESDHARFPVVRGGMDHLQGVINARQWLSRALRDPKHTLADQPLQAALYVPETITGMELLDNFRLSDVHMAFVIDEYGEVQGIVTLQDLIEAITGEFQPRDPRDLLGSAAGRWQLAAGWAHSRARTQGSPQPRLRARGRARSLPHPQRHGHAAHRPSAQSYGHRAVGELEVGSGGHGWQDHRQGAGNPPPQPGRLSG